MIQLATGIHSQQKASPYTSWLAAKLQPFLPFVLNLSRTPLSTMMAQTNLCAFVSQPPFGESLPLQHFSAVPEKQLSWRYSTTGLNTRFDFICEVFHSMGETTNCWQESRRVRTLLVDETGGAASSSLWVSSFTPSGATPPRARDSWTESSFTPKS